MSFGMETPKDPRHIVLDGGNFAYYRPKVAYKNIATVQDGLRQITLASCCDSCVYICSAETKRYRSKKR